MCVFTKAFPVKDTLILGDFHGHLLSREWHFEGMTLQYETCLFSVALPDHAHHQEIISIVWCAIAPYPDTRASRPST